MAPEETEIKSGEDTQDNPASALLKKHGVASLEELDGKIDSLRVPNRAFAEMRNDSKQLQEKLDEKDRELEELRDGLGSGDENALVREVRSLKRELSDVQRQVLAKPEDEALQPFMELALQKKPWIKRLPTAGERMDAARTVALGLRAETEAAERENAAHESGRRKADTISRTYVERQGGVSHGSGGASSEEADLNRYEKELEEAGPDRAKMDAVYKKWRAKYPHWGI